LRILIWEFVLFSWYCVIDHQGRHAIEFGINNVLELLERFVTSDYNAISNPSKTNLKLKDCIDAEKIDVTVYKQLVGSLKYEHKFSLV
jgi:hypothetical protein